MSSQAIIRAYLILDHDKRVVIAVYHGEYRLLCSEMLYMKTLHNMTITSKSSEKDLSHSILLYGPTCAISNKTQWRGYVGYPVSNLSIRLKTRYLSAWGRVTLFIHFILKETKLITQHERKPERLHQYYNRQALMGCD
eukprot:scaffold24446_cov73-Skeletonema_marinoi.AAC.1